MCGIAGLLAINGATLPFQNIQSMTEAMRRRGPDDEGLAFFSGPESQSQLYGGQDTPAAVYQAPHRYIPPGEFSGSYPPDTFLALGHRRLAILDLSPAGHQPMCTEDGRYWIVYNGEIYNFREIRARLQTQGERFESNCDTEVILKAYRQWGADCLPEFNGMWALAIWDAGERLLFCARDRIGIKPFYYYQTENFFLFASDIKTLIASRIYHPVPDWEGVYHGMSFYCAPRPLTSFQGVKALEQAHWMTVAPDGRVSRQRFWTIPVGEIDYRKSEPQWAEELEETLRRAVKRRLVADVPVGTFMSGGIDSTTMSAISAQEHPGIKAFTLAYEDEAREYDELPQAQATARLYPMQHIIKKVLPETALSHLAEMVRCYEEPFHSLAPNYIISQLVAENGVTVILNGLGPDEMFCGYGRERGLPQWRKFRSWHPLISLLPGRYGKLARLKEEAAARDIMDYYVVNFTIIPEGGKQCLFSLPQAQQWNSYARFKDLYHLQALAFPDDIEALGYMDLVNYIGNHHVYRVDQFTMHFSLEGRFPYLDHELVELAARIPSRFKSHNGVGKYILRQVAQKHIDPSCLTMKKKGFSLPVGQWMHSSLRLLVEEKIRALKAREIFNPQALDQLNRRFYQGNADHYQLWLLVSIELWLEAFMSQ